MDQQRYDRIAKARADLDEALARAEELRQELYEAVRDAFPETHGQQPKRGVLTEVTRRSGWSREHVAQVRDGKAAPPKTTKE
ncbi:hypothetical protein AB0425_17290 [Actinosynnema sp. NPDC051121]